MRHPLVRPLVVLASLPVTLYALLAVPPMTGCIDISQGGADAGASGGDGSTAAVSDGGLAGPTATGVDCITEQSTGVQICTGISLCPQVLVDHDVFPNCGFRIRGTALDLECACSGEICPLGTPSTCDQAAQMLKDQTEGVVCQQINEGRCVAGTPQTSSSSSSSTGGNGCDKTCASECGGDPNCVRLCGC